MTKLKSVSQLDVAYPMSWVDEERDTSCWLGNVMQREAFNKLYSVAERVHLSDDRRIKQDWDYLQASNNFRFMTTKNTGIWLNRGIYDSPYDAFTNYMNILADFIKRVDSLYPADEMCIRDRNCSHQTVKDTELVVQYFSDRSQAVSSTRSVRYELSTFNVCFFVYTANEHRSVIFRRS